MSNPLRLSWTCSRCLGKQQKVSRRCLATAATATAPPAPNPATYRTETKRDDNILRQIFDSRSFWQEYSKSKQGLWGNENVGLFQNHHLRRPEGFQRFAEITAQRCQRLLERVVAISTVEEYKKIVQYLDCISDLLCRVIDVADFVRSTHPDPAFRNAALSAHYSMFGYMNTLNTTKELYDQLDTALNNREVTSYWNEEELRVARILKKDFSQSAIHLPRDKRELFVEYSDIANKTGSRFVDNIQPRAFDVRVRSKLLQGVDPRIVQQYTDRNGYARLPTIGPVASHVLKEAQDASVRRDMYIASRVAANDQIKMLEELMGVRAQLAKLSGFESYGEMALKDKMAGSPEAVSKFLDALAGENRKHVKAELVQLRDFRRESTGSGAGAIHAWDREFYRARMLEASTKPTRTSDLIPSFFSLGTVMQGLSRLFDTLYGVRFKPVEPLPGETWSPEVRRLDVVNDKDERIAIVYCDLFAREGKSPNPAHFTLRCSRLITASEIAEIASSPEPPLLRNNLPTTDPVALANDGMATHILPTPPHSAVGSSGAYQLPTIALICDFKPPTATQKKPTLLSAQHMTTLFHEMGHAIHSILGRTTLQNVSGTRCATDFAELPSILMEHFATDPAVLGLYARHWESDAPLPPHLARQIQAQARAAEGPREGAADTEWQIVLSALDQAYHSPLALAGRPGQGEGGAFDSTAIAHSVAFSDTWWATARATTRTCSTG
ncbi:MAG: hypothetical protein LQ340_007440 [Diploschistes diacapsis]|nr:MAG: hypothetical protein LQ340_007440 [Diploschistes diacapsis]